MCKWLTAVALALAVAGLGPLGTSRRAGASATGTVTIESIAGAPTGPFTQGDGDSRQPVASTDGRFVAFESDATTFDAHDRNAATDVFVRDNLTQTVKRISAKLANGHETNDDSSDATIAANGTRVAYVSNADGITPDDHNGGGDAYVYDTTTRTTTRASVASNFPGGDLDGNEDGIDYTTQAAISADGNWVAFTTDNGLSIVDGNSDTDVYLRDLAQRTTIRLTGSRTGDPDTGGGADPAPSTDGCEIAFDSAATDIAAGDTNSAPDAFVYDRCNHSAITTSTQKRVRVSVSAAGNQANGPSTTPQLSATGRYVVFASKATNLVAPAVAGGHWQVFLRDRDTDGNGVFDEPGTTSTTLISAAATNGSPSGREPQASGGVLAANRDALEPAVSADGCVVAFASDATNLGSGSGGTRQVFTVDRCHSSARKRLTVGTGGAAPHGPSDHPVFTPDGDTVLFDSDAQNLVSGDTNDGFAATDVFSVEWRADTHAPLLTSTSVAIPASSSVWVLDTQADNFKPSWDGWDPSGVSSYTVDLARYFWNKVGVGTSYSPYYAHTAASSGEFSASVPGTTYCLRVAAATDGTNHTAQGAGPATCRALPLEASQLAFGPGWTKYAPAGAYGGTAYRTTAHGATMTRTFVVADRIALIATTCPTCGRVDVFLGKSLLAHVSLVSATTVSPVAIPVATWSTTHSGTLQLTVTSSAEPVVVQGVGVYQDH